MRWHCCIVEWALRKPKWWVGIQSCRFVSLYILLSSSFSRIFERIGKRRIGLYDATSVGFLPSFKTMMIFVCFKGAGQYWSLHIALKIYMRVWYPLRGISFSMSAVIRSGPGALFSCNFLITWVSSWRVKAEANQLHYFLWWFVFVVNHHIVYFLKVCLL